MQLSIKNLDKIRTPGIVKPGKDLFTLPEKVLQFGTGVLLRGLPDYFIDKANRQGLFNGRIVVVKSTESGDPDLFDKQDGLYTLCVRGVSQDKNIEENTICSAISRVLSAKDHWPEILQCAKDPSIQIIISNTTEVGIRYLEEQVLHSQRQNEEGGPHANQLQAARSEAPISYPGKLLAYLYERYHAFKGDPAAGMVIIPTELITDNGKKLAAIVLELAAFNKFEQDFIDWIRDHNQFCSSLVDRIVPGKPKGEFLPELQRELGYTDELLSIAEVYRLWAIEGDDRVQSVLSFAAADQGVVIKRDIEIYRELKLRLLNGTHTLSCGLAYLAGFSTVIESMRNSRFDAFVSGLMLKEIAPSIPYEVPLEVALDFGKQVLDRFRNPHLQHQWLSITVQYSSKIRMRTIPLLLQHYKAKNSPPELFSLGFAAYLLFMKAVRKEGNVYEGLYKGIYYPINDERAAYFMEVWEKYSPAMLVHHVLQESDWWGVDLSALTGFEEAVINQLNALMERGAEETLASIRQKNK